MKKDLCIVQTQYSLLLYILMNKDWKKTVYFLWYSRISDKTIIALHNAGGQFLCGYKFLKYSAELNKKGKIENGNFKKILKKAGYFLLKKIRNFSLRFLLRIGVFFESIFGNRNSWRVYAVEQDYLTQMLLDYNWKIDAIEEGNSSYLPYQEAVQYWKKFFSNLKYLPGGWSSKVRTIYMAGIRDIPAEIKLKATIIDLPALWAQYSMEEQRAVCEIFQFDYEKLSQIVQKGYCNVLLAENFAPDFISVKEQIEIYDEILSKYDKSTVIIKRHPASTINYKDFFPECYILEDEFPFELFLLTKIPVRRVITIHSTAAFFKGAAVQTDCYEEYYNDLILPRIKSAQNADAFFKKTLEKLMRLRS